jgi:hypothetical protein
MSEPEINLEAIKEIAQDFIKKSTVICKSTRYFNQSGTTIDHREIVHGDRPENFVEYIAYGSVELKYDQGVGPQGQPLPPVRKQHPIMVPVEANSILEAFEKAPGLLEEESNEVSKQFDDAMEKAKRNVINAKESEKLRRKILGG